MADLRRFGVVDFILLLVVLALAGATRAGYLVTCCDNGRTEGPLRVQDVRLPVPFGNGKTDVQEIVEGLRRANVFRSHSPIPINQTPADTAHVSPGYPWLLGMLSRVVGGGQFDNETKDRLETDVRWGQCVLGSLTAGLYFLFARRAFGSIFVAALAGIFCALHPFWVIDTATIDDGVLATFLLSAVMFFGARGVQASGAFSSLLYGLALAALALTRAALLPFSVVAFLWFLLRCRNVPMGWLCGLLAFLGFANGLVPWTVYNWYRFHEIAPIVHSPYPDLWAGNHPGATGGPVSETDWDSVRNQITGMPRLQAYEQLATRAQDEVVRDQVDTVNRRLAAGLYFFFGERWFRDRQFAERNPLGEEGLVGKNAPAATDVADSEPTPGWWERTYPGALAGTMLGMLILGVLGWRWSYGWRFTAMPSSLAVMWIPLPYILTHAEALSGPRLPLDGVLLCYAALAVGCFLPRLSTPLLAGYRPATAREVVRR
jgi:hypothetical protein